MRHYRIFDTASGEKLGLLGFDPASGFFVEQPADRDQDEALRAMAEDLNELETLHIEYRESFTEMVSHAFARTDPGLPEHIPAIIMQRFLMTAEPVENV